MPRHNFIDLTGKRFGRLTVIEISADRGTCAKPITKWICKCDCGNEVIVAGSALKSGRTISCGCYHDQMMRSQELHLKHGGARKDKVERLYYVWSGMKDRCYYKKNPGYKHYGGRGINVCEEWRTDYAAFRDWAMANGYNPDAARGECTIDRIDPDGDYEPGNCRWVGMDVQNNNRRNNKNRKGAIACR